MSDSVGGGRREAGFYRNIRRDRMLESVTDNCGAKPVARSVVVSRISGAPDLN